jgi:tRNA dimethylallyltransferase
LKSTRPAIAMQQRPKTAIVVVAGPTGVGKTRAAVELCKQLGGEIVGADSVQVYRGFDIGSCKPGSAELDGVIHHLIDIVDPTENIDAAGYAQLADATIAGIIGRGRLPVVAGGTGLWLRALLRGLVELPAVDKELRAELELEFARRGGEAMHRRLAAVDPATAARVHSRDMIRIVRALEVHAQTGTALGELQQLHAGGEPRYDALTIVLDSAMGAWLPDIARRARVMLEAGLVDEVRALMERFGPELRPLRSVGYRQVVNALESGQTIDHIEREIIRATRLYGKRQRTWFRSEPSVDLRLQPAALRESGVLTQIRAHLSRKQ